MIQREKLLSKFIFIGFGMSGAAALIYEVVWTRNLSIVMGSSTYALSTMLAAFMAGLSVGGWIGAKLSSKIEKPGVAFALAELGIGIMGVLTIPIIKALTPVYISSFYRFHLSFNTFSIIQFIIIFAVMGIPTTLMGTTFPLVVKLFTEKKGNAGEQTGHLYCVNTFGAIMGSVSAGFLLIPIVGTKVAAYTAASLNITTALIILALSRDFRKVFFSSVLVLIVFMVSIIIHGPTVPLFTYYSAARLGGQEEALRITETMENMGEGTVIYHHEGINGEVYLTRYRSGEREYTRALFNNGKLEGGDEQGFALLAMLPYFTHETQHTPTHALNIGLGSGHTLANLARFPLNKIDSIELSDGILEVNRRFLSPGLFQDPRIKHIQADGRNFLLINQEQYDLVVASPSWAVESASAGLLTMEFFSLVKTRLHESGTVAIWVDYFLMDDEDLFMVLRTMAEHFDHVYAWYVEGDNVILVGSNFNDDIGLPQRVMKQVLDLRPDLEGKFKLAFSDREINNLPTGRTNTDDIPAIEFHNARHIITGHGPHRAISPM